MCLMTNGIRFALQVQLHELLFLVKGDQRCTSAFPVDINESKGAMLTSLSVHRKPY